MRVLFILLCLLPISAVAAGELVYVPESQHAIGEISEPEKEQYLYGELSNFPHTFTFSVSEPMKISAMVSVPKDSQYKKSVIIIREEKNGVSEVGRVTYNETSWTGEFDARLGRSFFDAEVLSAEIEPGSYRLEVSSPDNHGKYKLRVGTEPNRQWFFTKLKERAAGAAFFGNSWLSALRAPLVSATVVVIVFLAYVVFLRIRKRYG